MKKTLWKILLVIGVVPFAIVLLYGIYVAITGFSGVSILGDVNYGFGAFLDWIILYSYVYWSTYVIGLVLIILSVIKLKKSRS